MALTTVSLDSSLATIGISNAKGVELPLLREQNDATLSQNNQGSSSSSSSTRYTPTLTPEQQREVAALQRTDRDVHAHEEAHILAGRGVVTSGPDYTYTYGPDGKRYAVGGEVGIDTSPEHKPEENIDKGVRIQAAALAPKDPSAQDYQVARVGVKLETQGRQDLSQQQARQQAEESAQTKAEREARQQQAEESRQAGQNGSSGSGAADVTASGTTDATTASAAAGVTAGAGSGSTASGNGGTDTGTGTAADAVTVGTVTGATGVTGGETTVQSTSQVQVVVQAYSPAPTTEAVSIDTFA